MKHIQKQIETIDEEMPLNVSQERQRLTGFFLGRAKSMRSFRGSSKSIMQSSKLSSKQLLAPVEIPMNLLGGGADKKPLHQIVRQKTELIDKHKFITGMPACYNCIVMIYTMYKRMDNYIYAI